MASVVVTPASSTLRALGETVQLAALARDEDGREIPGKTFVWSTSDERVAALSATALLTAVSNGQATVSATTDGVAGTAVIHVAQAVAAVQVTPGNGVLTALGQTLQLAAAANDARGNAVAGKTATWASAAPSVATVDAQGLVTAVRGGSATITATVDGVAGNATVQVSQQPAKLGFLNQPTTIQKSVAMAPLRVAVQDARGHTVETATDVVTITLASNPAGGTLSGTRTVAATTGIATFSSLTIDREGSAYTLLATSGTLTGTTSAAFDVISTPARIDSVKLTTTTLAIGGLSVPYTAWSTNASGRTLTPAGFQGWIEQGSALRAAGGALVSNCSTAIGYWSPGKLQVHVHARRFERRRGIGNARPGTGDRPARPV